jgi:hypothetical protein
MKLITKEILDKAPPLYANEGKLASDVPVIAKFFCPWNQWTWYMTELDPDEGLAFGLVVGFEVELGYFSIPELESISGPGGLKIERDLHFGKHSLGEVKNGARP